MKCSGWTICLFKWHIWGIIIYSLSMRRQCSVSQKGKICLTKSALDINWWNGCVEKFCLLFSIGGDDPAVDKMPLAAVSVQCYDLITRVSRKDHVSTVPNAVCADRRCYCVLAACHVFDRQMAHNFHTPGNENVSQISARLFFSPHEKHTDINCSVWRH